MKKWIAFSFVLCLLFSLSACGGYQVSESGLPALSGWRRSMLNRALKEYDEGFYYTEPYLSSWGQGQVEGYEPIHYYGNFEGYDVVFYRKGPFTIGLPGCIISCGQMFECTSDCVLVGVKDGVVCDLNELYKKGEISRESGAKIHEYYELYNKLSRGDAP